MGTHGHALGVVACRCADDAFLELLGAELDHLVVGSAQLEAEHGLLVLALEQHLVVQAPPEIAGRHEVGLHRHVVDTGGQDLLEIVGRLKVFGHFRGA